MRINLNADVGEGFGRYSVGDDETLLRLVGSANIACGMHAGDPSIMAHTVRLAVHQGVSIGAHPGFNDLWGFGRRPVAMGLPDLESLVLYQIGALQAIARSQGARVTHVKPHGALNNQAHDNAAVAMTLARAVMAADPSMIFVANVGSEMVCAAEKLGLRVALEAYVDRHCDDHGRLLPRSHPEALIYDPAHAADRATRMLERQAIYSVSGKRIPTRIHTLCLHGDEPTALALATHVRAALESAGAQLVPLPALWTD